MAATVSVLPVIEPVIEASVGGDALSPAWMSPAAAENELAPTRLIAGAVRV